MSLHIAGPAHELGPDRQRGFGACQAVRLPVVKAHPHQRQEPARVADEPGIATFVRGPRFPGQLSRDSRAGPSPPPGDDRSRSGICCTCLECEHLATHTREEAAQEKRSGPCRSLVETKLMKTKLEENYLFTPNAARWRAPARLRRAAG